MLYLRPCLLFALICVLIAHAYSKNVKKTYIIYMGDHPKGMDPASLPSLHMTMAQKVLGSDFEPDAILRSYKKSFNGFVMKLTEEEAQRMAEMDSVVSVFPNKRKVLRTTRSWDFLGFSQQVKRTNKESDIIVGVLDSGIWPESKSFSDKGFGPPPTKWKGSCHNITCNNKIIGAKYFLTETEGSITKDEIISPIDTIGHGTHTASTVAGNLVSSASLLGSASGTARGGVPSARVAAYKMCWSGFCSDADILAGFDDAIADGVDIISVSVGGGEVAHLPYFKDAINIGAFHAIKRGILTSNSANNLGPFFYTMTNYAPWLLSVAASTIDRKFFTKVQLGDGAVYEGVSINTVDLKGKLFPLIYAGDAPNTVGGFNGSISRFCSKNSLNKDLVKGKIVLCENLPDEPELGFLSGAIGVIIGSTSPKDSPASFALPFTFLSLRNQRLIHSYIKSASNPTATLFKSDQVKDSLAPYIASFSSRGPNPITPNILKPDIAAPGVDILAAWSPIATVSGYKNDKRVVHYNLQSGTSMACPHATAVAAYVKTFHPKWSPAMIKSALMTTATPMSAALNPEAEFAYGAGQINPVKAANPGLVYDISEADYVNFLCGEGYEDKILRILTKDHSSCNHAKKGSVYDLNLPSFALHLDVTTFSRIYHRTVTNVGSATSTYKAKVIAPSLLDIKVKPSVLSFTSVGQKRSFSLIIEGTINVQIISASLVWDDGTFRVRSPIVLYSGL